MTIQDLLAAVRRRWYVTVAILLATAALGFAFARDDGVYSTRTVMVFTVPEPGPWESAGSRESGVIALASAVATQVGGTREPVDYAAADAPYYGAGIRQGVRVGLPDSGGQWDSSYTRAAINIDVVSPDRAWVVAQQSEKLRAVSDATAALQRGISASGHVDVAVDPLTLVVEHIGPSRLSQALAAVALAAVGAIVGAGGAAWWDRRLLVRRGQRAVAIRRGVLDGRSS
jgi:hypothetical protein